MNINLKATGIELTPAISEYVQKKIGSLEKFLPEPKGSHIVRVEVGRTTQHHKEGAVFKAEVHITGGGLDIYALANAEDLYAAIDVVESEAVRELVSRKGKRARLQRLGERAIKQMGKGFSWGLQRFRRKQ